MSGQLNDYDRTVVRHAVDLSGHAVHNGQLPFGAALTIGEAIVAEGINSVIQLTDPTAHAEIVTLREAGQTLGRPLFEDATLYSSAEPCPMCLAACYWAYIRRVVFAADHRDVAAYGFDDLRYHQEISEPAQERSLDTDPVDDELHRMATQVLSEWSQRADQ